jgi:hypothetical protein
MAKSQNMMMPAGALPAVNSAQAASPAAPVSTASGTKPPCVLGSLRSTRRTIGLGLLDAAMLAVAFLTADLLRCTFWQQTIWPQPPIAWYQDWCWYLWALPVLMLIWPASLAELGFYRPAPSRPMWRLPIEAGALLFLCFSALALFFSRLEYPRMLIVLTSVLALLSYLGGRLILAFAAHVRRWCYEVGLPNYEMYSRSSASPTS